MPAAKTTKKVLKLAKVIAQPVFVVEENGVIVGEAVGEQHEVHAGEWPTFAAKQFPALHKDYEQRVNAGEGRQEPVPGA